MEKLLTEVIGVARPSTGHQDSKGWIPPRARGGGQTGRPTRTYLALRNKQHSYLLRGLELDPCRLILDEVSACRTGFACGHELALFQHYT